MNRKMRWLLTTPKSFALSRTPLGRVTRYAGVRFVPTAALPQERRACPAEQDGDFERQYSERLNTRWTKKSPAGKTQRSNLPPFFQRHSAERGPRTPCAGAKAQLETLFYMETVPSLPGCPCTLWKTMWLSWPMWAHRNSAWHPAHTGRSEGRRAVSGAGTMPRNVGTLRPAAALALTV